jgi:FMN phosphatase YigB (HAD superfamily)
MTVKGVFFDFWGTLCVMEDMDAELDEWITALHSLLQKSGLSAPREVVLNYYHARMRQENPPKPDNGMTIFERRIEIAGADLGVKMTRAEIEYAAAVLLTVWDKHFVIDRVCVPVLGSLNKQHVVTGLISNFDHPRHVHDIVSNTGMKKYFSAVIVSGDHDFKKPDPQLFRIALSKTGLNPAETVFVGDSEEDITGANSSGMISVLIDRKGRGQDYGQKYTISTLPDVLQLTLK